MYTNMVEIYIRVILIFARCACFQIMFETLNVDALCVLMPGVLTLYGLGVNTGLVLDCGEGMSQTMAVSDGAYTWRHGVLLLLSSSSQISISIGNW